MMSVSSSSSSEEEVEKSLNQSKHPISEKHENNDKVLQLQQLVINLLDIIRQSSNNDDDDETQKQQEKNDALSIITQLEQIDSTTMNPNDDRFEPLLGLYTVSYIISQKNASPAGGKWTRRNGFTQRLFQTRNLYQHLVPKGTTTTVSGNRDNAVAEAINVVSLDAFFNLLRLTIILRGDVVPLSDEERHVNSQKNNIPLSNLAIRAFFDPPRIAIGKRGRLLNINLGPKSSVILDTTYCDDRVRIGKGGTSASRFVFCRCEDDDKEAMEWKGLLQRKPLRKLRALGGLAFCFGSGVGMYLWRGWKLLGVGISSLALLGGFVVMFSSGGIEQDDVSARMARDE